MMEMIKESDEEDGGHEPYIDLCQGDTTRDLGYHECIDNDGVENTATKEKVKIN